MSAEIGAITGSAVRHPPGARRAREADPAQQLEVSVYLKPQGTQPARETREQMRARRSAEHADDLQNIRAFAAEHGLRVVSVAPERRLARLSGSAAQFGAAFQTSLGVYDAGQGEYRGYEGSLSVPANLASSIESVLGLDTRPVARPHLVKLADLSDLAKPALETIHRPNEMAALYNFPANVNGAGQCVAIIELGGGYLESDFAAAFAEMSLPVPAVVAVGIDGGTNNPGHDPQADGEVALDMQIAAGVAPGVTLAVYFAPPTSDGFVDAITAAASDPANRPSVMSISWGDAEAVWATDPMAMASMNSALADAGILGVTVFVASGDHLANDGRGDGLAHVDFPAASRFAIGVGGTAVDTSGSSIKGEVVWNSGGVGTGGGISDYTFVPAWQSATKLPPSVNDGGHRRGVPDVAANADPNSGYIIVVGSETSVWGGTSCAAPLWAGLTARLNQMMPVSDRLGFFLPGLYRFPSAGRDITVGNNRPPNEPAKGYDAAAGWDACTGLGSPDGNMLAMILVPTAKVAAVGLSSGTLHLRVYAQSTQNVIQEYSWDGQGWAPGVSFPGAALDGQVAAVLWTDTDGVHIRVYYQDTQDDIIEQCFDGQAWHQGNTFTGVSHGTGIAAMAWSDAGGLHIRLYYQNTQNTQNMIVEQSWDGGWRQSATSQSTGPVTGISAVQWTDASGHHQRLYYQNAQNLIDELRWDGKWVTGITFAAGGPAAGVAALNWTDADGRHQRLYYQGAENTIVEQRWDGTWTPGNAFAGVAPGTGAAALNWTDADGLHIRLYFQDIQNAVIEQCWDGKGWTIGATIVPPAG
jgi:kumamolisin